MGGDKKNRLNIFTLGRFDVIAGDENIFVKTSSYHKVWKLFKFLITKRENTPEIEVMMETLWPGQKVKDINHTFRNLIYRLKSVLKLNGNKKEEYINLREKTYEFNFNSDNYWFDALEFESLSLKADNQNRTNCREAIKTYKKAIPLYNGFYLPGLVYEDWTFYSRNFYHKRYIQDVRKLVNFLNADQSYEEIVDICEDFFNYEMFDETIHFLYLQALLELNNKTKAGAHYDYYNSLFKQELGLEFCSEIRSICKGIKPRTDQFLQINLEEFRNEFYLKEKNEGAFYCESVIFRQFCKLEKIRAQRNKQSNFLCSLSFFNNKGKISTALELKEIMKSLKKVLLLSLRKGDIVCRWSNNEYLIMISDINASEVRKILLRIQKNLKKEMNLKGCNIYCQNCRL